MVQCFLEVSLSSTWMFSGVFQGPGRRWPKKMPSGSDSEEEEQVGQGSSLPELQGDSRRSWSPALGGPLSVSWLELATIAESAGPEMASASEVARSHPSV